MVNGYVRGELRAEVLCTDFSTLLFAVSHYSVTIAMSEVLMQPSPRKPSFPPNPAVTKLLEVTRHTSQTCIINQNNEDQFDHHYHKPPVIIIINTASSSLAELNVLNGLVQSNHLIPPLLGL